METPKPLPRISCFRCLYYRIKHKRDYCDFHKTRIREPTTIYMEINKKS